LISAVNTFEYMFQYTRLPDFDTMNEALVQIK